MSKKTQFIFSNVEYNVEYSLFVCFLCFFLQLVGHKKPQAPLFAPNLGLLEPMKAPTELQIAQAEKDPLTFAISDSSSTSSAAMSSAFSPQVGPCHFKLDSFSFFRFTN